MNATKNGFEYQLVAPTRASVQLQWGKKATFTKNGINNKTGCEWGCRGKAEQEKARNQVSNHDTVCGWGFKRRGKRDKNNLGVRKPHRKKSSNNERQIDGLVNKRRPVAGLTREALKR